MGSKGLITKNKDVYKKNILRISITEKGKQKYRQIIRKTRIYEILSCLSTEQLSELTILLDIISSKAHDELECKR
jgi:DNA-binding MarR family transcriptional regulator